MDNVAIYCRLSDEDRCKVSALDESESIRNQKILLGKYAIEKGWAIYKIYSDDDYSGLDKDRPEFNKMIEDAETGKFNIILCKHQSRFTRDMELVEKYLHGKFLEWKVRFVSITDNADTFEKGNKKSRQINGLVNEWYSEDISEAIKATFKMKMEAGKFIGSFAAYGYEKDPKDKNRLVIDEEAAKVVRMIFGWYLDGHGTRNIAYMLNALGIPNPAKYKQSKGLKFKNSMQSGCSLLWSRTAVKRILENRMYTGCMIQSKRRKVSYKSRKIVSNSRDEWIVVENTHDAVIDNKDFMAVSKRIKGRMRSSGEGQAHIFSTRLRCMDCGSSMNKVTASNCHTYLRCRLYAAYPAKKLCTGHSIRFDRLQGTEI